MKRFLLFVLVVLIGLALSTCPAYANGYGAAPRAFDPGCATCAPAAPALAPVPQLSYVPQTQFVPQVSFVPQVEYVPQTTYTPQLSFAPGYVPQRSFAPGCYSAQLPARSFAPRRGFAPGCYGATASFGVRSFAPVSYGVGAGSFASARNGRFVAGSPGFVAGGVSRGFVGGVGGGTSVAARNVAVTAAPGQAVDVRTGGLRGVLFGARVRVR